MVSVNTCFSSFISVLGNVVSHILWSSLSGLALINRNPAKGRNLLSLCVRQIETQHNISEKYLCSKQAPHLHTPQMPSQWWAFYKSHKCIKRQSGIPEGLFDKSWIYRSSLLTSISKRPNIFHYMLLCPFVLPGNILDVSVCSPLIQLCLFQKTKHSVLKR